MSVVPSLYYPFYVPPDRWVRAYLLFFDRVRSIVPKDIKIRGRDETEELFEKVGGNCFDPLRISPAEFEPSKDDIDILDKGFNAIKENRIDRDALSENLLYDENGEQTQGWVIPTHPSKVQGKIYDLLDTYGLLGKTKGGALVEFKFSGDEYHAVDKDACCMIMALHANRIARQNALQSITNVNVCFSLNAGRHFEPTSNRNTKGNIAAHIIALSVPSGIAQLPIEDYLEVRRQYSELRNVFQDCINNLFDGALFEGVTNQDTLKEKVIDTSTEFLKEARKLQKKRDDIRDRDTLLFSLGGICTIASPIFPSVAIPLAIASVSLATYDHFSNKPDIYNLSSCQLLMADLKRELAIREDIHRFM